MMTMDEIDQIVSEVEKRYHAATLYPGIFGLDFSRPIFFTVIEERGRNIIIRGNSCLSDYFQPGVLLIFKADKPMESNQTIEEYIKENYVNHDIDFFDLWEGWRYE